MGISKLFPKKEMTELEIRQRQGLKEMKKIRRKFYKNPLKVTQFMDEAFDLMDSWLEEGLMTQKEYDKEKEKIIKDMDKANKIMDKFRR